MISGIVLAAGMSTRMGEPKPLLRISGKTSIRHVIDALKMSRLEEIIVVLGHEAAAVSQAVRLDDVKIVVNPEYQKGMSTSLRAGIGAINVRSEAVLVALVDQPLVKPVTIDRLIDEYRTVKSGIVIPVFQGVRGNPVLVDRRFFPELMEIYGDVGCRAIFHRHPEAIHRVEVNDPGILVDIDTPEDLQKSLTF